MVGRLWQSFRQALNTYLSSHCGIETDRLIGPFFLTETEVAKWEHSIPNKLLPYLREDLLRFEPGSLFQGSNTSMPSLIEKWKGEGLFIETFVY